VIGAGVVVGYILCFNDFNYPRRCCSKISCLESPVGSSLFLKDGKLIEIFPGSCAFLLQRIEGFGSKG
jgi:hypothetical protein